MRKSLLVIVLIGLLMGGVFQIVNAQSSTPAPAASPAPAATPAPAASPASAATPAPAASPASAATPAPAASPAPAATPAAEEKKVKTIWDYNKELGLSDDQVKQIKDLVVELSKKLSSFQDQLKASEQELNDMIAKEESFDKIKAKLQHIAALEVDMRYADIQFSRKINHVLSKDQLAKWHKIQEDARAQGKQNNP